MKRFIKYANEPVYIFILSLVDYFDFRGKTTGGRRRRRGRKTGGPHQLWGWKFDLIGASLAAHCDPRMQMRSGGGLICIRPAQWLLLAPTGRSHMPVSMSWFIPRLFMQMNANSPPWKSCASFCRRRRRHPPRRHHPRRHQLLLLPHLHTTRLPSSAINQINQPFSMQPTFPYNFQSSNQIFFCLFSFWNIILKFEWLNI